MVGGCLGARVPPPGSATFSSASGGRYFDTGSASSTRPSSTSIMMAVEVMALVMEAMEKIASVLSGSLAGGIAIADGLQVRELAAAHDADDGAGHAARPRSRGAAPRRCGAAAPTTGRRSRARRGQDRQRSWLYLSSGMSGSITRAAAAANGAVSLPLAGGVRGGDERPITRRRMGRRSRRASAGRGGRRRRHRSCGGGS